MFFYLKNSTITPASLPNRAVHRHVLKHCGACHPAQRAARRFARQAGQRSRRRRNERSERCMRPARQIIDLGRASRFGDRSPTVGEAGGTNAVSVAFFPREPWAIRMEKRTATNAVSWSELRRALKLWKYRKRYFLHNKKAQRSIKLLRSNVFYVQGHSRLTAERHRSAMLLRRSDSLRLETCPGLRSKSRKVPCESHRTLVRCHFARRADGDPLGKTDSKQAVACWSVSVVAYRHCCRIFRTS